MIADVDMFLSKSSAELQDIRYRDVIKCPKHVFIESGSSFFQSNFDTVSQQLVPPIQVLFLNTVI